MDKVFVSEAEYGDSRFIKKFIKQTGLKGKKVLVKPNLLCPTPPEELATTHPSVVKAVIEKLLDMGNRVAVGDSSAAQHPLELLLKATGIEEALKGLDYVRADIDRLPAMKLGLQGFSGIKTAPISSALKDTDAIINLPKLKTHMLTGLTGAVKNFFGLVPREAKKAFHARLINPVSFSALIADIGYSVHRKVPSYTIMDAIRGLQGNGPKDGEPLHLGLLVAGQNPFQVDHAIVSMVEPEFRVMTDELGKKLGLIGEFETEGLTHKFFLKRPKTYKPVRMISRLPNLPFLTRLVPVPVVTDACVGCSICKNNCPVKAIKVEYGRARIDPNKCVRCYTCAEVCPQKAIKVSHRNIVSGIIDFVVR